jgi:hypothetical protein
MAWHLRRLLEAVKEAACGLEGRWRWLTGPLMLLTWIRTRRERREAAEAMRAVQGMLEAFLGLLEDFRAGRLAEGAPEVDEAADAAKGRDCAVAYPSPSRCAGPSLSRKGRGIEGADGADGAVAPATSAAGHVGPPTQWIPSFAGMTGAVRAGGAMVGLSSGGRRSDGRTFNFYPRNWRIGGFVARAPPGGRLQEIEATPPGFIASILLLNRN